jgi:hypothetical protein
LLQQEDTKKIKTKTTGLPPVKRFLYSHIARLTYLIVKMGEAHEELVLWRVPLPWEVFHTLFVWKLKHHIAFLQINDSTCSMKKRSTKNNRTGGFIPHIHDNEINRYKSRVDLP